MNAIFPEQTCYLLGWTMLHFLWIGTALLLVAAIVRLGLRRAGANFRYAQSLATLLALAALPIATAAWISVSLPPTAWEGPVGDGVMVRGFPEPAIATTEKHPTPPIIELNPTYKPASEPISLALPKGEEVTLLPNSTSSGTTDIVTDRPHPSTDIGTASGTLERALSYIQTAVPYLPYLWLLGTPITFALLATGLIGAERMRRHGTLITDGPVYEACERLRSSLRITRKVTLAVCDRVAQPVLVGIVRPLILLPPVALTGWSPEQLEMVLLHELAHVRRWDNLVNLAQRVIESLLFFHPAVWIVSTWVRRDREECCDTLVVTRTSQPKQYAELLIALASPQPFAGTALARHPLAGRLRRILKLEDEPMLVSRNTLGLLALGVVAIALVVISGPLRVQGEGKPVEEGAESDSAPSPEEENKPELPLSIPPTPKVFDSEQERDIAIHAFGILHLKLVPATEEELEVARKHGHKGGVKIVTHSNDRNGVAILTKIESTKIESLNDVARALDQIDIADDYIQPVSWEAVAENLGRFGGTSNYVPSTLGPNVVAPKYMDPAQPPYIVPPGTVPGAIPVAIEPPSPSASPLAGIAYPSPREGEIARRAWKEFGIKVAPATGEELEAARKHGNRGGLKLVDFDNFPQFEGVPILTHIESRPLSMGIVEFADLKKVLDAIEKAENKPDHINFQIVIGTSKVTWSTAYSLKPFAVDILPTGLRNVVDGKVYSLTPEQVERLKRWLGTKRGDDLSHTIRAGQDEKTWVIHAPPDVHEELQKVVDGKVEPTPAEVNDTGEEVNRGVYSRTYDVPDSGNVLEELEKWIQSRKDIKVDPIKKGGDPVTISATKEEHEHIAKVLTDITPKLPFLSLEDQKIADRAYKLLGIELEPLSKEELAVVKHHGFEGGLRIANSQQQAQLVSGDLLVGLHVWPVTDFRELETIFNRDDLAQLNPMKYYAVRSPAAQAWGRGRGGYGTPDGTSVISGRIQFDIRDLAKAEETQAAPKTTSRYDWRRSMSGRGVNSDAGVTGRNVVEERADNSPPLDLPPLPFPSPPKDAPPKSPPALSPPPAVSSSPYNPPPSKPVYRYDGKTFQTWRDTWKHELSTEKRIEAVKALAAFGRAGYAKEAAEAILDVAGEYDNRTMENKLHSAITDAFTDQIKFDDWHPLLREQYDADPTKWESIAVSILRLSRPESDENRKLRQRFLLDIAKNGTQSQNLAFQSLVNREPGISDEEVKALALERLKSNDSTIYSWAVMGFARAGVYPPEFVEILLHGDDGKQKLTRSFLRKSGEEARPLIEKLLSILRDKEQAADHLAAIRAFGAAKESADSAIADLKKIATNEKADLHLRVAAAVALDQIDPKKDEGRTLLLSDAVGKDQETRIKLMMEEMRKMKLPATL